ncbi:thioredoxin peroxidase, partial [Genlisea aurea]
MAAFSAASVTATVPSNSRLIPRACISPKKSNSSRRISFGFSLSGDASLDLVSHRCVSSDRRRTHGLAASEVPHVGNTAPDFEAEAVFDQEFIKV